MKSCQVWGDLSADRVNDQYPIVTVCNDCTAENLKGEETAIVAVVGGYDAANGEACSFCGITAEEEGEEENE